MIRTLSLFTTLLLATPFCLHADTTITFQSSNGESSSMAVRQGIVSMGMEGDDALFDSNRRKMVLVDHERRAFYELDPDSMAQQSAEINSQMSAQMEQMLKSLPEDQRELMKQQMEKMMGAQGMPAPSGQPDWQYVRTGKSQTVRGYRCDVVEVRRGQRATQRVCVTSPKTLGVPEADIATLRAMFDFFGEMGERINSMWGGGAPEPIMSVDKLGGIPVRIEDLERGEVDEITGVSDAKLDAKRFEIPANYNRAKMPGL